MPQGSTSPLFQDLIAFAYFKGCVLLVMNKDEFASPFHTRNMQ